MRLFIAFPVPNNIKDIIRTIQERMKDQKIRFTKEQHCTLKFLGDVDEEKLKTIKQRLTTVTFNPIKAVLDGLGVFPNEREICTIWVGLQPHNEINAVQKKVEDALKRLFPIDNRFHPHLTVGRVSFLKNRDEFLQLFKKIEVPSIEFTFDKIQLIKSTLTKEGPVYEVLAEF